MILQDSPGLSFPPHRHRFSVALPTVTCLALVAAHPFLSVPLQLIRVSKPLALALIRHATLAPLASFCGPC